MDKFYDRILANIVAHLSLSLNSKFKDIVHTYLHNVLLSA